MINLEFLDTIIFCKNRKQHAVTTRQNTSKSNNEFEINFLILYVRFVTDSSQIYFRKNENFQKKVFLKTSRLTAVKWR